MHIPKLIFTFELTFMTDFTLSNHTSMDDFDVDLVYLWVDGDDPEFRAKRNLAMGKTEEVAEVNCDGRVTDNDELRFSLRAVEQYAPWIRNIFIVSDNQIPEWLDTSNPKIHIIDQNDIIPKESIPTFNSVVIEHQLHRIPGRAEHFLYSNDDMFFNRPVSKSDFYTPDGQPIIRLNRRLFRGLTLWLKQHIQGKELSTYNKTILKAGRIVEQKTGKFLPHKPHHNIDAFLKSQYEETFNTFREEITATLTNQFRSDSDIQRVIYSYYPIAEKRAKLSFVDQKTSFRLHIDNHRHYEKLQRYNPMLFCLNDSQYAVPEDRVKVTEYLKKRFPDKSSFEK